MELMQLVKLHAAWTGSCSPGAQRPGRLTPWPLVCRLQMCSSVVGIPATAALQDLLALHISCQQDLPQLMHLPKQLAAQLKQLLQPACTSVLAKQHWDTLNAQTTRCCLPTHMVLTNTQRVERLLCALAQAACEGLLL